MDTVAGAKKKICISCNIKHSNKFKAINKQLQYFKLNLRIGISFSYVSNEMCHF